MALAKPYFSKINLLWQPIQQDRKATPSHSKIFGLVGFVWIYFGSLSISWTIFLFIGICIPTWFISTLYNVRLKKNNNKQHHKG